MERYLKITIDVDTWENYCGEKCYYHTEGHCELFSKQLEKCETSSWIKDARCYECYQNERSVEKIYEIF
jgi:hypothetical protein